ncbi:MAG TPA: hypothetical protein VIR03_02175 [Candidatus Saccharimonadales bacterium]
MLAFVLVFVAALTWRLFVYTPSASRVLKTVTGDIKAAYANLAVDNTVWPAQMGSQLSLHDSAYNFNVSSQNMPSFYVTMREVSGGTGRGKIAVTPETADSVIAKRMKAYRFSVDEANSKLPVVAYGRRGTTCLEIYDKTQAVLTFTCYEHSQIYEKSKEAQPFVKAYNIANSTKPVTSAYTVGPIVIKSQNGAGVIGSSRTANYDIAEAVFSKGVTKKLILFYKKGSGDWRYVAQANDEYGFSCADYKADSDIRAAMHDQVCLDDFGPTRLDTNNRVAQ